MAVICMAYRINAYNPLAKINRIELRIRPKWILCRNKNWIIITIIMSTMHDVTKHLDTIRGLKSAAEPLEKFYFALLAFWREFELWSPSSSTAASSLKCCLNQRFVMSFFYLTTLGSAIIGCFDVSCWRQNNGRRRRNRMLLAGGPLAYSARLTRRPTASVVSSDPHKSAFLRVPHDFLALT